MAKITDEELSVIIRRNISNSEHLTDGKLQAERREVDKYYRGELPKPQHSGDSKYVSRDVFETVDSMRSTVLEAFLANQRIVYFQPESGETVDDAKQATEYCRHVFFKENCGEDILYDAITDGLMKRLSVVKVSHEAMEDEEEYEFEGLTLDELGEVVLQYTEFEFTETDISDEGLYSGAFTVPITSSRIVVENIQPEDFLVSSRTADLKDAKYCIHRVTKSKSELIKLGYDKTKIEEIVFSGSRDIDVDYEKQQRFEAVDDIISTDDGYDESVMEVIVYEAYIRLDVEGTGTNKLYRVVYAGGEILEKEPVKRMPFASFVPLPIPHTFFGDNYAHGIIPVQNARTVLVRQIINHSLITNNPRMQVLNGTVRNPNELVDNRVGGIVNVRRMDGLAPIPQAPLNPFVFNLISMIDEDKEEVSGISKLSQGMNKDAVSTQNSQGMVEQLISQSQQRTKIVTRRFGKFLRELYHLIYSTAIDYVDEAEFVAVTGSYVEVNPTQWSERNIASVELTLGYGEREQEAAKWLEMDQYFANDPTLSGGYDYAKRYEVVTRAAEARGVEDLANLLTPPDQMEPPQPSEAEVVQMEQMKAQTALIQAQATTMLEKAKTDRMNAEASLLKARAEAGIKTVEAEIRPREFAHEVDMDHREFEAAQKLPQERQSATLSYNQ